MKSKKCKTCKQPLTILTNVGWVHPTSKCREDDGIRIMSEARKKYNETYGTPNYSLETLVQKLQEVIKENNLYCIKNPAIRKLLKWKKQKTQFQKKKEKSLSVKNS